jgi:hypothetical protein
VVCGSLAIKEYLRHWLQQYQSLARGGDDSGAAGNGSVVGVIALEVAALSCFEVVMTMN